MVGLKGLPGLVRLPENEGDALVDRDWGDVRIIT